MSLSEEYVDYTKINITTDIRSLTACSGKVKTILLFYMGVLQTQFFLQRKRLKEAY